MKTEPLDLPNSSAPPGELARALRSLVERLSQLARDQIERYDRMPGPPGLERELAACEAFIRETSAASGLGLDYEGGRELAEAKRTRSELRREREELLQPYRRATELWRAIRARLAPLQRRPRGLDQDPERLRALMALLEDLSPVLPDSDLQTLRAVRAQLKRLAPRRPSPGRDADGAAAVVRASQGPGLRARDPGARLAREDESPGAMQADGSGPGAADPDPELLSRYLPPPGELEFEPEDRGVLERVAARRYDAPDDYRLNQIAQRLSLLSGFEVLLCTPLLRDVEQHPFQLNTARQVMRGMRGRALLCDEVGLGKTIEAGLVLKEYLVRGLVRRVLVLTPPSLVSQWREEMSDKFGIAFATLDDPEFRRRGPAAWQDCERVIASIHTVKSSKHSESVRRMAYDLIIVDEAHHLRNRTSLSWKFVNQLKSKHLLLLTATPAQNDLEELYNLITLLCPGQLKSPASFRREFVERDDPRKPRNRTKLRELLMDVMVRNTRSQVSLRLPPREATTLRIALSPAERTLYDGVTRLVRTGYARAGGAPGGRIALQALQAEAGSSAPAVRATLEVMRRRTPDASRRAELEDVLDLAARIETSSKALALLELLGQHLAPGEKVLVFTQYLATQALVARTLERAGIAVAMFNGTLTAAQKDAAVSAFARDRAVLVSTDVGSEGRNLQFCHTIVNYDLPWNPMRIEQRVGRAHRIGQSDPVRIFNLAAPETIEDHILDVLDRKINMFELVVGEIGEILGNLEDEREFEDIVLDLWAGADSDQAARARFTELGDRLAGAQRRYLESKAYDEALFGQEFAAPE